MLQKVTKGNLLFVRYFCAASDKSAKYCVFDSSESVLSRKWQLFQMECSFLRAAPSTVKEDKVRQQARVEDYQVFLGGGNEFYFS